MPDPETMQARIATHEIVDDDASPIAIYQQRSPSRIPSLSISRYACKVRIIGIFDIDTIADEVRKSSVLDVVIFRRKRGSIYVN